MTEYFGIEMSKLFKFNSSHFVAYENFREPLHGHNYKVSIKIKAKQLNSSFYVVDFDIVKTLMNKICENLKHCLLVPKFNKFIKIEVLDDIHSTDDKGKHNVNIICQDGSKFSFPEQDIKIIETDQISAECLAKYITQIFYNKFQEEYPGEFEQIQIKKIVVKVSEDNGKAGCYYLEF